MLYDVSMFSEYVCLMNLGCLVAKQKGTGLQKARDVISSSTLAV